MRFFSLLLTPMIALQPAWAQTPVAGPTEPDSETALQMQVVDDPGAAIQHSKSGKGYTVSVTDSTGVPVSEAAVAFRLPERTGRFPDGTRAMVVYTDAEGKASFPAIYWDEADGQVELRLTAAKGTAHAGLLIEQMVRPEHPAITAVATELSASPVAKPAPPPAPEILVPTPQPGSVSKPLSDMVPMIISRSGASAPTEKRHGLTPNPPPSSGASHASSQEPTVSITNSPSGASSGSNRKKWLVLAAIGAAAGAGAVLALQGHGGGGSATSSTGVSIGTPTISIGH